MRLLVLTVLFLYSTILCKPSLLLQAPERSHCRSICISSSQIQRALQAIVVLDCMQRAIVASDFPRIPSMISSPKNFDAFPNKLTRHHSQTKAKVRS